MKHQWTIIPTFLKHPCNSLEASLKCLETSLKHLKHPITLIENSLKHFWITPETSYPLIHSLFLVKHWQPQKWRRPQKWRQLQKWKWHQKWRWPQKWGRPKNEDNLKNEDGLKNEDDLKNKDSLKHEDNLKNEDYLRNVLGWKLNILRITLWLSFLEVIFILKFIFIF